MRNTHTPGKNSRQDHHNAMPKPVLRRLMPPLTIVLILLILGFLAVLIGRHEAHLEDAVAGDIASISERFSRALQIEAEGLDLALQSICRDREMREALKERDKDRLLADYGALFEQMRADYGVTHFYFLNPVRICLLRVHKPEKFGDLIDRFTARTAEETGRSASGIELGPLGTFTLRVVRPVFEGGDCIGFVELGKEIEHILQSLHDDPAVEMAVTIHKEALDRRQWEAGMRMLNREPDWERFLGDAIIYHSTSRFPEELDRYVDEKSHVHADVHSEIDFMERSWRVVFLPLADVSGRELGNLIVLHDVTRMNAKFLWSTVGFLAGAAILVAFLWFALYGMLKRTDSDIRRRETELEDAREQQRAILDGIPDVIALQKPDHTIVSYNRAGYALLNMPPEAVDGKKCFELIGKEAACDLCPTSEALKTKKTVNKEKFVPELNAWFHVTGIPILDSEGTVTLVVEKLQDITDRKRAEDALRESEERLQRQFDFLRTLMETIPNPIYYKDAEGFYLGCNRAFADILGLDREEIIGKTVFDIAPRELAVGYREMDDALLREGGVQRYEGKMIDCDSKERNVIFHKAIFHLGDGSAGGIVGGLSDITALKEKEREIRDANLRLESAIARANELADRAESANRAKSEFLANMSHEIRTPLNGVIGMMGLLLETNLDREQRRYSEMARLSGEALLSLINDILDYSKIEAGKLDMDMMDFDLRALLDDFGAMMAARAHEKDLEFICAAAPEVPALLQGDPGRLRQILINLAGNAIKFTDRGEVSVRAATVSETEDAAVVRFSVRDTGIGIPSEKQGILFESFTQADGSVTRKHGGTGLGLAICKQLVGMMGGTIGVNSETGAGSEFWFTARFGKQADLPRNSVPHARIRGVRVLVVDDNATNREVLTVRLRSWGARTEEASDGSKALHALRRAAGQGDPFEAAILDMQMPGMDGATLGQTIKTDENLKATRLVMMTSQGRRGDAGRMSSIGFSAYLIKPLKESDLFDSLSAVLAGGPRFQRAGSIITRHSVREFRRAGIRVLLAEDNVVNQKVALGMLQNLGLRADVAENGVEVLEAFRSDSYDLVFMDVQMPEMDGIEAARAIRGGWAGEKAKEVYIIAMTAHAMRGDREKCLEAGMNDYIAKPVEPSALAEAVEGWLAKPATEEPNTVFDQAALLDRLMGKTGLVRTVVEGYLEDIPRRIEALRNSLKDHDTDETGHILHTIKGASANVNGESLRQAAVEMENCWKAGDRAAAESLLPRLEAEFHRLREAMEAFLNTNEEGEPK